MATLLDAPSRINDGDSYAAVAGSNRQVVIFIGFEEGNSVTVAPTMGTQAFAQRSFLEGPSTLAYGYIGTIDEADIPTGSQTITINESAAIDTSNIFIMTLNDSSYVQSDLTEFSSTAAHTIAFTATESNLVLGFDYITTTAGISPTIGTGWSAFASNGNGTSCAMYGASKTAIDGADSYDVAHTVSRSGVIGFAEFASTSATIAADDPTDGVETSITVTGFDSVSDADIDGYSLSVSGTLPNLVYTLDLSGSLAGGTWPRFGEDQTLTVNGEDSESNAISATDDITLSAASGWAYIEAVIPDKSSSDTLASMLDDELGVTTVVTDKIYYEQVGGSDPEAGGTSIDDSFILQTSASQVQMYLIQGNTAYAVKIILSSSGNGPVTSKTVVSITIESIAI